MSVAGDQDDFGDGIAEGTLKLLAQVESLKVIARTSSLRRPLEHGPRWHAAFRDPPEAV